MQQFKKILPAILLAPVMLAQSRAVFADHGSLGFGIGTAAPVITQTAVSLPDGMWAGGIVTNFTSFDSASDAELLSLKNNAVDDAHGDVHSIGTYLQPSVFAAYGVTDDLTLGLRVPYILRSNIRSPDEPEDEGSPVDHVTKMGDANGFGDVRFFGQYRFFHTDDNLNHVALLFSLKTPTGRTSVKDNQGNFFEAHHQPGSGSWDPSMGLAFTRTMGAFSLDTSGLYTVATKGAQNTNLGDSFEYNIALSYAFGAPVRNAFFASSNNAPWTAILELNGEWRDKQETGGLSDPNSGGNTVYISPGVRFSGGKHWNTALSFGAPIVKDFNGYQTPPDYRIVYRLVAAF
ncbi:transporter [Methylomicrobium lacus]|uniref:transporter n=1 Tax=Methylomicrobium lacus TaxID=136992 RepID=UPI00045EB862|nr:transporter [Methylomicrobium lacus]